jgi:hypothetical protein
LISNCDEHNNNSSSCHTINPVIIAVIYCDIFKSLKIEKRDYKYSYRAYFVQGHSFNLINDDKSIIICTKNFWVKQLMCGSRRDANISTLIDKMPPLFFTVMQYFFLSTIRKTTQTV